MDVSLRAWAARATERIDASMLAEEAERREAAQIMEQIAGGAARPSAAELLVRLDQLVSAVEARESGLVTLTNDARQELEEGLATLENRLVGEINQRKHAQRRDLVAFLVLLFLAAAATLGAGAYMLLNPVQRSAQVLGQSLALVAALGTTLIVARLFQNSREALERLDEKVVAVRFLRMALHPSWSGEVGGRLMAPALAMFAQHFAPTSSTLGVEDTTAVLGALGVPGSPLRGNRRAVRRPDVRDALPAESAAGG